MPGLHRHLVYAMCVLFVIMYVCLSLSDLLTLFWQLVYIFYETKLTNTRQVGLDQESYVRHG